MKKILLSLLFFLLFFTFFGKVSYADLMYKYPDSDIFIRLGGLNRFQGKDAKTREEAQQIEFQMAGCDYMSESELSEEERKILVQGNFWFSCYLKKNDFVKLYTKTYLYKPLIDKIFKEIADGQSLTHTRKGELMSSTVVIDYSHWHFNDLAGTFDDEVDDKIPSYYSTGYMQIISPVSCNIVVWNAELNRYYRFYVTKNTPFLVRLKSGSYHIVECNNMIVKNRISDDGEDTLPFKNRIQINEDWTKENPYIVELEEFVIKYQLKDFEFTEETETERPTFIPDVPTEQTQIKDTNKAKEKSDKNNFIQIFSIISLSLLILFVLMYGIMRYRRKYKWFLCRFHLSNIEN